MTATRVLLVEDDDALRPLLEKYLSRLGFQVDTAISAEDAWALFEREPARYPLLLVDLTLPGMPGDQLMRRVLEANTASRVLLSSGYPYDLTTLPASLQSRAAFLQKPYLPRQLADQIKSMVRA
jgi:DNA-binding response OmpR family regulator